MPLLLLRLCVYPAFGGTGLAASPRVGKDGFRLGRKLCFCPKAGHHATLRIGLGAPSG